MHRSGTSATSGLLALLGAHAPKSLMVPTKDNIRGYFESVEVMKANDRVLSSAGSRWSDWGQFNPCWFDSLVADRLRGELGGLVEEEYGAEPLLLIKDPRISRFLPLWLEALSDLGIAPRIVIPVRHPLSVARSLEVRDHFGRNRSLLLWLRHVLDAEAGSRQLPRIFVRYENVLADWRAQARRIAAELDVVWPKWSGNTEVEVDGFLSSELRHHPESEEVIAGDSELDQWVRQTYEALLQASGSGLDQASMERLDRIRGEFNRSSTVYAAVVREHELRVEAQCADMKARLDQSVDTCHGQSGKLAEAERKLAETLTALAGKERQLTEALAALAEKERQQTGTLAALAEQRQEVEMLKAGKEEEEHSKLQLLDEQLAVAAAARQAIESAAAEHKARLAEQEERHDRAAREHREVAERLRASEAEIAKLRDAGERQRSEARDESARVAAAHCSLLVEKDQEIAKLTARIEAMAAEQATGTMENQSRLEDLQKQLSERKEAVAQLSGELSQLKSSMAERSAEIFRARTAAQSAAAARLRETARFAELLSEREKAALAQASRSKRETTLLEFRNAFTRSTLTQRSDAWQHQANTYAQMLQQIGSSRAWRVLARVHGVRMPEIQAPELNPGIESQVEALRGSELFDAQWYLEKYPDVADSGMEPERHYLLAGAPAGYNPGPEFDAVGYLAEYPDVLEAAMNPLVHYLKYGQAESRTRTAPADAHA